MEKIIFAAIFAFLAFFLAVNVQAATLSLSPGSGNYSVGQTFSVDILLNTESTAIDGVDIVYLNYNPVHLEVVDDNASQAGIQITPGALMPMTLANSVNVSSGRIIFSQITSGGTKFTGSGAQVLATMRFRVLQAVSTQVYFDFIQNGTADTNVASSGNDVLTSVTNGNYGPANQPPAPTPPAPAPSTPGGGSGGGGGGGGGYSTSTPKVVVPAAPAQVSLPAKAMAVFVSPVFNTTLNLGMSSPDVKRLQQILNSDPDTRVAISGIGSLGNETEYFGTLTEKAVQKFQCKYSVVCLGTRESTGYGVLGKRTRAKIVVVFSDVSPAAPASAIASVFNVNLNLGMSSPDVKRLQQILNSDPDTRVAISGIGSLGNETEYFGTLTEKAVQKFQKKYGIAQEGDPGYGYVGPKTRAKLQEVFK